MALSAPVRADLSLRACPTAMSNWNDNRDCLIFSLTGKLYGVAVPLVREIVRLPEVTPMEDAPGYVVGVMNLRGRVVPVLDLNVRMGRLPQPVYHLSDAVVVLEWGGTSLGIIINDVREVRSLNPGEVDDVPAFEESEGRRHRFINGVARVGEALVMLLDPEHLLHLHPGDVGDDEDDEERERTPEVLTEQRRFNPGASEADLGVFRERALRLMHALESREVTGLTAMAVVRLHGELLAVDLGCVKGFAQARQVTAIPCCPEHVVGGMNLRGTILTVVDLTRVLGLHAEQGERSERVMVAEVGALTVGVLVNEVVDVIHLRAGEIVRAPTAAGALRKEHLKGAARYGEGMLGILNLEAILTSRSLLVNEDV